MPCHTIGMPLWSFVQFYHWFRVVLLLAALPQFYAFCSGKANQSPRLALCLSAEERSVATEVRIRDSLYAELGAAVDVIMASFYADSKPPWNHMYRLAELNRLQQGFPYADRQLHRVLVAVTKGNNDKEEQVVGYCDCDLRKPNQSTSYKFNPRPYVSDLCVHPSCRRQGIAKMLVQRCEEHCQELGKPDIYIRVERNNDAAIEMYTGLGYFEFDNPLDDSETIVILRKLLSETDTEHS